MSFKNAMDDNPTQASQEIAAGNSALASFNAANGGILNATIQRLCPATKIDQDHRQKRFYRRLSWEISRVSGLPSSECAAWRFAPRPPRPDQPGR
jgi:hypothetical protein